MFDVGDAGEEDAGVGDDHAAWLEEDAGAGLAEGFEEWEAGAGVFVGAGGVACVVIGGEATAEVEGVDGEAFGAEFGDHVEDGFDGLDVGFWGGDGGAEVEVDGGEGEVFFFVELAEEGFGVGEVDAELGAGLTGGDVGVAAGFDVGVDAESGVGAGVE